MKFIKKILGIQPPLSEVDAQTSIQKLVSFNSLNKRKNLRIKYPHFGAFANFPKIVYKDAEMIVSNISVGGLLIVDDTERFGQEVGEVIILTMEWSDFSTKVRARIVGANQQRRHLQFVDFNAQAFLRITHLSKPAYLATRFHRVRDDVGRIQALEFWVGPTNETLAFYGEGPFAEYTSSNNDKFTFLRGSATLSSKTGLLVPPAILCDLIVLLANLPQPTACVRELIEVIETEVRASGHLKRTGTNG